LHKNYTFTLLFKSLPSPEKLHHFGDFMIISIISSLCFLFSSSLPDCPQPTQQKPITNEWHCPRCGRIAGDFAKKCWYCGYEKRAQALLSKNQLIALNFPEVKLQLINM
jgi:hypothetical protein